MSDDKDEVIANPDPHFEPLVNLPAVQTKTLEEDEEELVKLRAKLYRYDSLGEPREWKERGTGDVKILKHRELGTCRVLMRRDKTLKICANHSVLPQIELKPNCGSDRAWVWSTPADFADEEAKQELLAIRFANAEHAQKFKEVFETAKALMKTKLTDRPGKADGADTSISSTTDTKNQPTSENGTDRDTDDEEKAEGEDDKKTDKESDKETDNVVAELDKLKMTEAKGDGSTSSPDKTD